MASDDDSDRQTVSRRRFVALAGISGTAALAGCTGGGGNDTTTGGEGSSPTATETDIATETSAGTTTSSGGSESTTASAETTGAETTGAEATSAGTSEATSEATSSAANGSGGSTTGGSATAVEVLDQTMTGTTNTGVPKNYNLNPLHLQNYDYIPGQFVFERLAAYNYDKQEMQKVALDDWKFDNKTVTLTLRDDLKWDNGEDLKAETLTTRFKLGKKVQSPLWDFADSVEQGDDDKTVVLNLKAKTNPRLLKLQLNGIRLFTYPSVFKKFLDQEPKGIQQFAWEDNVRASGPFKFDSKSQQAWTLKRNENYYNAQNINFKTYELLYRQSNTAIQQGLQGGELESMTSLFVPKKIKSSFPDSMEEFQTPAKWGYGILLNHDDPVFGKRKVRQAIAHVINRKELVQNAGPDTKFTADVVTGIAPKDQKKWLGDGMGDFESYGVDASNTDKATQLMKDAGLSKDGGTWKDDNGKAAGGQYYSPAGWTDWTTQTNSVVDQLNSFGFDLTTSTKPVGDWMGAFNKSNFRMGAFYWMQSGTLSTYPYYILRWQMLNPDIDGGHNYPADEKHTIPSMSGSGTTEINPLKRIKTVGTETDKAKIKDTIQKVAWHHNVDLPAIGLVAKNEQTWVTKKGWKLPSEDDPARQIKWPDHYLPRVGKIQAKQ